MQWLLSVDSAARRLQGLDMELESRLSTCVQAAVLISASFRLCSFSAFLLFMVVIYLSKLPHRP